MLENVKAAGVLLSLAGAGLALLPSYQAPHYRNIRGVRGVRTDFIAIEAREVHHGGGLYTVDRIGPACAFDGQVLGQELLTLVIERPDGSHGALQAFGPASAAYKCGDKVKVYQVCGGSSYPDATGRCYFATPPIRE